MHQTTRWSTLSKPFIVMFLLLNLVRLVPTIIWMKTPLDVAEKPNTYLHLYYKNFPDMGMYESGAIFPISFYDVETIMKRNVTGQKNENGTNAPTNLNEKRVKPLLKETEHENPIRTNELSLPQEMVLVIVTLEILTLLTIVFWILGPLTKNIPIRHWVASLLRFRNTWEGLLWAVVAVAYAEITLKFHAYILEKTEEEKYGDEIFQEVALRVTIIEYLLLGVTESVVELYTPEKLKKRISSAALGLGNRWGNATLVTYILCTATFALRNFLVCLYFAVKAVFEIDVEKDELVDEKNVGLFTLMVVLQTMIAGIRFSYGYFFMRLCLNSFFNDGKDFHRDSSQYEEIRDEDGTDEESSDETSVLKHATRERYNTIA